MIPLLGPTAAAVARYDCALAAVPNPGVLFGPVVGFVKGKSAIWIAREFSEVTRGFVGKHFWARGYFVSPMSRDEEMIRTYTRHQESEDRRTEQLGLL